MSDDEETYEYDEYEVDYDYSDNINEDEEDKSHYSGKSEKYSTLTVSEGCCQIAGYLDVEAAMNGLVQDVSTLLEVSLDLSRLLLQHFSWDKERLVEMYYSDSEKVLTDAGLKNFSSEQTWDDGSSKICRICCDEYNTLEMYAIGCNHCFCKTCYGGYLSQAIADGPSCIQTQCPEHKCKQLVPQGAFLELTETKVSEKYRIYLTRNYIEMSKNMRWCPSPGCNMVAVASGVTTVLCTCGKPFCFKCGEEAHDPINCSQLAQWTQKCVNESETANWIIANTKKCPKCTARIEKNQGCNHMTCKICKNDFCWICLGSWEEHGQLTGGYYKCNKYDPNAVSDSSQSAAERAKLELERYLHYYQRYHGHDHSLKFAAGQRETAERRMLEMQESGRSAWIDAQFLKQAVEQVIDCRRVLKYTYSLGYFMDDGTAEKHLFEHHQEMLEKHTEKLSEYTEQPLDGIDRTQVINLTRVTEKFMQSLLSSLMTSGNDGTLSFSGSTLAVSSESKR